MGYILGDWGITMERKCVTIYSRSGGNPHLSRRKVSTSQVTKGRCSSIFRLLKPRQVLGQTFGVLMSWFPALHSLPLKLHNWRTQATAYSMILAACVLHNLLLNISDPVEILDHNYVLLHQDNVGNNPDNEQIHERSQRQEMLVNKMIALHDGETDMEALDFI